jgi:hypothetical protein
LRKSPKISLDGGWRTRYKWVIETKEKEKILIERFKNRYGDGEENVKTTKPAGVVQKDRCPPPPYPKNKRCTANKAVLY